VAVGLTLALECSRRAGLLEDAGLPARIAGLLERLGLPPSLAALRATAGPLPTERLEAFLQHDKKNAGGEPRFVLPRAAGLVELDVPLEPELVAAVLAVS
jgi:3-dehydroquinate synthetase